MKCFFAWTPALGFKLQFAVCKVHSKVHGKVQSKVYCKVHSKVYGKVHSKVHSKEHSNAQTFITQVTCTDKVGQETDISAESFEIQQTRKYK